MSSPMRRNPPPDHPQRLRALDPSLSVLVQAPAGSGKTTLLAERFLALLCEVQDPAQIVAITFTKAAAAEMRNRILDELRNPNPGPIAARALAHSQRLNWNLLDLPAQLRISTIDSFCRELALQQPRLSGFGGNLNIAVQPAELYRRAARQTLSQIGDPANPTLSPAIETLLLWRDNNWEEVEDRLVEMLEKRDQWMHGFVLDREPNEDQLRARLERPFAHAICESLTRLSTLLDRIPGAPQEALALARSACTDPGKDSPWALAEAVEIPSVASPHAQELEAALDMYLALAGFLLTAEGTFRKRVDKNLGFPPECKAEKARLLGLIARLAAIPGLESALAGVRSLPPLHYTGEDWQIVRACFTLLSHAAGQLRIVFAEAGELDFTEIAQMAQRVLRGDDGLPTDAAIVVADNIRHLLVDEFQDTSRRQHQLLASLIAAWPDRGDPLASRTAFVVGDPMQSIYSFREADAELFPRVRDNGLEIPNDEPLRFDSVALTANFRTAPPLVNRLNDAFEKVFAVDDGSGVTFFPAEPARSPASQDPPRLRLHFDFVPQRSQAPSAQYPHAPTEKDLACERQIEEIVSLIRGHQPRIQEAAMNGQRYRVAVLGRARNHLAPIAQALRAAAIPFRAVELEGLASRPDILDALVLARALFNPHDRVAWLGVLRAPWCGLSLAGLHTLAGAEDPSVLSRPIPELAAERLSLLSIEGQFAVRRVLDAFSSAQHLRSTLPASSLGTWLQQVWLRLGGDACVEAAAGANLDLLWQCLDALPEGEQDLLGPALQSSLAKLTALPDPAASSDCGVQLMTIHKSKGLEFEVVVVPELQAGSAKGSTGRRLLSWLERGLATPADSGEITEFLVAPMQPKGADRGGAKQWVDGVYAARESQEMRRLLYVAATRAREELHLFARPAFKTAQDGSLSLPTPANTLLATAWPAFKDEIQARFDVWKQKLLSASTEGEIESLAASGEGNLLRFPCSSGPRRLPPDYRPPEVPSVPGISAEDTIPGEAQTNNLYQRHEGGLLSRALGISVHTLLQDLARLHSTATLEASLAALQRLEPRIGAEIRAAGIDPAQAARTASQALQLALDTARHPIGQWILAPHPEAACEVRWTGLFAGGLRTVQADRVFRAGPEPRSEGVDYWWLIDYKTTHAEIQDPTAGLPRLRAIFAPQLEAYAAILRKMKGADILIRACLCYPRLSLFDWWEI